MVSPLGMLRRKRVRFTCSPIDCSDSSQPLGTGSYAAIISDYWNWSRGNDSNQARAQRFVSVT